MKLLGLKIWALVIWLPGLGYAQNAKLATKKAAPNWQLQGLESEGVYGAEVHKAYALLKKNKVQKVKVAVLDGGLDEKHPALSDQLWTNPKEIPGNGIDDDGNGYVDDIHGWNFLGGTVANLVANNLEADREYIRITSTTDTNTLRGPELNYFRQVMKKSGLAEKLFAVRSARILTEKADEVERLLKAKFPNQVLTIGDLKKVDFNNGDRYLGTMVNVMFYRKQLLKLDDSCSFYKLMVIKKDLVKKSQESYDQYYVEAAQNYRANYGLPDTGRFYGNNQILPISEHGTHVAGIIAGQSEQLKGISQTTEIIAIKSSLDGDEYDIDVANGIRYAVDQGARIINMSFGKYFSGQKELVDRAIKYAEEKDVLLVFSAGNVHENLDTVAKYPSATYLDGSKASNVIIVGASDQNGQVTRFSNYGIKTVDLYAPGQEIYSSVLNGGYAYKNGTSMAAPVVSGIAAMILAYYPDLKPHQLISLLRATVTKTAAVQPSEKAITVQNSSISGGIVNAYQAILKLQSSN